VALPVPASACTTARSTQKSTTRSCAMR
jgi:hypothetical protein